MTYPAEIEKLAEAQGGASVASDAYVAIESVPWPEPLSDAAYHGLAGEFVRLVEPHSEADPVALMMQFLVGFGSLIGRKSYFRAEADRHYTNIYSVMVGATSKGRKGTSWGQCRTVLGTADEEWATSRIVSGLSSGEGLIWQVRDPILSLEKVRKGGRVVDTEEVLSDPGVEDKRLLVIEAEFASTLRMLGRDGNILSAVLRQGWDGGNLRTLTKNSPAVATGAHISVIGHITKDELCRYLDRTEAGNGFANRFLWVCVKRSKLLPEGGNLHTVDFASFTQELKEAVTTASYFEEVRRGRKARERWIEVYGDLSEGSPGLFGAVTSRAEAQVMRVACLYSLLDRTNIIRSEHLDAALELWRFARDSARFIFGDALGDPVADEILRSLRAAPDGMTRTEIRDIFGRHRSNAIRVALSSLVELGRASFKTEKTDGRSAERWFATKATKATEAGEDGASVAPLAGEKVGVQEDRPGPDGAPAATDQDDDTLGGFFDEAGLV